MNIFSVSYVVDNGGAINFKQHNMIDKQEFLETFKSIFEEEDLSKIDFNTEFKHLDEWDSLIALSLITVIDSNYGLNITGQQIEKSNTVGDLYKLL